MKIRVPLVVDIDPAKWAASNGQIVDAHGRYRLDELRADVRQYVLNMAQCASIIDEADGEVTLGAAR